LGRRRRRQTAHFTRVEPALRLLAPRDPLHASRSGETDTALANQGEGLKRESVNTDRSSEWADGLRIEDSTGSLLLNPIGGRMDTTRGAQLNKACSSSAQRTHSRDRPHARRRRRRAEASSVQERFLEHGANVVAEGVVEDIKGRLFPWRRRPLLARASRRNRPPSTSTVWLGRGLIGFAVLCGVILIASCGPPRSDNPLSDIAKAKIDVKLMGSWRGSKDKSPIFFQVSEKENGLFDAVMVAQDDKKGAVVLTFEGLSTELGGKKYLNLATEDRPLMTTASTGT